MPGSERHGNIARPSLTAREFPGQVTVGLARFGIGADGLGPHVERAVAEPPGEPEKRCQVQVVRIQQDRRPGISPGYDGDDRHVVLCREPGDLFGRTSKVVHDRHGNARQ